LQFPDEPYFPDPRIPAGWNFLPASKFLRYFYFSVYRCTPQVLLNPVQSSKYMFTYVHNSRCTPGAVNPACHKSTAIYFLMYVSLYSLPTGAPRVLLILLVTDLVSTCRRTPGAF